MRDSHLHGDMQLDQAAVEYAAGKLHQVKKARGLPTLSVVFLRGNIFSENWADQLGGPFDCVHVGGSCARERIHDLMRLVKEGVPVEPAVLYVLLEGPGGRFTTVASPPSLQAAFGGTCSCPAKRLDWAFKQWRLSGQPP